ncbi:MAG: sigma-70 family RNA polymerase sigma factor [Clostridiales bacterium]|nr:sigma-70 family RNA polymerase sigma factor [Clostridiales bacterium]
MAKSRLDRFAILAKGGDEDALRLVYEESRDMLRSKANLYFMVGADRDDVIQEGMIGLLYAVRTFDPDAGASFKTFAELCVKRRIINALKMAGRKKHMPLNESVSIETALGTRDEKADPEEIVLLADLLAFVESNAPMLFSGMERAVWDAYSRGASVSGIAEKLEKSQKSVENTLTRIKTKIERLVSFY